MPTPAQSPGASGSRKRRYFFSCFYEKEMLAKSILCFFRQKTSGRKQQLLDDVDLPSG